jgi:hypothetical protein
MPCESDNVRQNYRGEKETDTTIFAGLDCGSILLIPYAFCLGRDQLARSCWLILSNVPCDRAGCYCQR